MAYGACKSGAVPLEDRAEIIAALLGDAPRNITLSA